MQPGPVIRNDMQNFNQISSRHRAHPAHHLSDFHTSLLTVTNISSHTVPVKCEYGELTIPNYTRKFLHIPGSYLL